MKPRGPAVTRFVCAGNLMLRYRARAVRIVKREAPLSGKNIVQSRYPDYSGQQTDRVQ